MRESKEFVAFTCILIPNVWQAGQLGSFAFHSFGCVGMRYFEKVSEHEPGSSEISQCMIANPFVSTLVFVCFFLRGKTSQEPDPKSTAPPNAVWKTKRGSWLTSYTSMLNSNMQAKLDCE